MAVRVVFLYLCGFSLGSQPPCWIAKKKGGATSYIKF